MCCRCCATRCAASKRCGVSAAVSLIVLDTVSRPLELLRAPLARLDARRDGSEWFVFNRRGMRKALELAGWVVEETTPVLRDHAGPGVGRGERALRLPMHVLGMRGRSAAVRARPLAGRVE